MNTKNCNTVEVELIQSIVNNNIFGKLIDVFVAVNFLRTQNEINSEFMKRNGEIK